jgi:large subunit ribosomal protein L17
MRKNIFGRQLKRDTNERKALFKGLISHLVLNERIKTTEEKAKSIKGQVDKIITKAKKGKERARYLLQGQLPKEAIEKVILEITPRFSKRQGGYTRIIRIGRRFSDNAQMVLMEWTVNKSQISTHSTSSGLMLSKVEASNLKSQKLEPGAEVHEEKTPKTQKKVETRIRKKDAKK